MKYTDPNRTHRATGTPLMNPIARALCTIALVCLVLPTALGQGRATGKKPTQTQRPATSQPAQTGRNARVAKLTMQAHNQSRLNATHRTRESRLSQQLESARILENGARRSYETLRQTRGERSSEAKAARRTLDASRATRANLELNLDTARGQARESRRQLREANRALSRARKGDWAGANRAQSRLNQAPPQRPRKITFASTVQIRTVSMAPDVVAARKGDLKPKKR